MKPVRIIGAGFSGLTLAYELRKRGAEVEIFEKDRVGGMIQTQHLQSGMVESAANGFLACREIEDLCKELNLEILEPNKSSRKRFFIHNFQWRRWPLNFSDSCLLVLRALQFKMNQQKFKPLAQENMQFFVTRVLNENIYRQLVRPALQGIYGADIDNLSANLVTSSFTKQNQTTSPQRGQYRGLIGLREGTESLLLALKKKLLEMGVSIEKRQIDSLDELKTENHHLIAATSLADSLKLLGLTQKWPHLAASSLVTATIFLREDQMLPEGFGGLSQDQGIVLGVLFNSQIFADRAADGLRSETWILNGELCSKMTEDELLKVVLETRNQYGASAKIKLIKKTLSSTKLSRETIVEYYIKTWPQALPSYSIELETFLETEKNLLRHNAHGNYLGGIGLSKIYCRSINLARELTEEVL